MLAECLRVELPHGICYRVIVRVDQEVVLPRVAGDVEEGVRRDALDRMLKTVARA